MLPLDDDVVCSIVLSPWSLCSTLSLLSHLRVGRAMIRVPSCFVIILHQMECSVLFTATNMYCISLWSMLWSPSTTMSVVTVTLQYQWHHSSPLIMLSHFMQRSIHIMTVTSSTPHSSSLIIIMERRYCTDSNLTSAGTKMLQCRSRSVVDEHRP